MYTDDIKLFSKNEKDLKTLKQIIRIYRQDIGMDYGTEKCAYNEDFLKQLVDRIGQPN